MITVFAVFPFLLSLLIARPVYCCPHERHSPQPYQHGLAVARVNNARRAGGKTAIVINVGVFDGHKLLPLGTVVIEGGVIVAHANGAEVVDGQGGVLISGLINAHTHPNSVDHLEALASYGEATTIVASCYPDAVCKSLEDHPGLTDIRFAGMSANSPNSSHALMLGLNASQTMTSPDQADQFVDDQQAIGATSIKIVVESAKSATTLDQATMNALVSSAHANDVRVVCHAFDYAAIDRALTAQTLRGGVPILAGSDSNDIPALSLPFGRSLHDELRLLIEAGMSTVDVLRSATVLAARHNLLLTGVVAPGMRADLLLISGDPIANISATLDIQRVWIAGWSIRMWRSADVVHPGSRAPGNVSKHESVGPEQSRDEVTVGIQIEKATKEEGKRCNMSS
ncbi:hypothetical protein C8R43DRAFT_940524 [Mycena crocata]|nr:hypothetical protein C8R43DRAFT_940524 [Mycena crocata]